MIRLAKLEELDSIMQVINEAKIEFKEFSNPQWGSTDEDYPSMDLIKKDIENKELYVYVEDNNIKGVVTITFDKNREYDELVSNSKEDAYIIHRLAISNKYKGLGIASKLFDYACSYSINNNVKLLKSDTEIHNVKMNNLFIKLGFIKKGEFEYSDYPGHYIYYEKEVK